MGSEGLMHLIKGWRKAVGYSSIFAAVPAFITGNSQDVRAEEGIHDSQTASRERGNLPRRRTIKPKFLGSGQNFANSRGTAASNLLTNGSDNCFGTPIPSGTYTTASPYVDNGDTTGANNTVGALGYYYYWYYYVSFYGAEGPDRIYSFTVNSLGAEPKITVTTTSPTYRPLIYVSNVCPDGVGNALYPYQYVTFDNSRWGGDSDNTAEVTLNSLEPGRPYYFFVDSEVTNDSGAYTLTLKDMQITTTRTNYALASNGGVASASSEYSGAFPASGTNNGDRKGANLASGGVWQDASDNTYPDWLQIEFNAERMIDEIDVFTVQDNWPNPSEPNESMLSTMWGITAFDVQYWNGSEWVAAPNGSITNNNKVWTKVTFPEVSTSKVRVSVNNSINGVYGSYSRIAEVEAWGGGSSPTPTPNPNPTPVSRTNFALASNGGAASASSEYSGSFPASGTNNGDRKGGNLGSGGVWQDATDNTYPDWLQILFNGEKPIDEIDVFTVQDNWPNPSEPNENMLSTMWGVTDFDVQYWNGSDWVTVPNGSITNNNKVWTKVIFPLISTTSVRVRVNNSISGQWGSYSRLAEVEAWSGANSPPATPTPAPKENVALASKGAVASASSQYEFFPPSATNNGDRKGLNWATGGIWNDLSPNAYPDFLQINFGGTKTIDEIDVFAVQDNYQNPLEPTLATTFTQYGVTAFDVQYWNGSAWVTVSGGSVTGNNKVWTRFTFPALNTSSIRVQINNGLQSYSRLVEVEAWGN